MKWVKSQVWLLIKVTKDIQMKSFLQGEIVNFSHLIFTANLSPITLMIF